MGFFNRKAEINELNKQIKELEAKIKILKNNKKPSNTKTSSDILEHVNTKNNKNYFSQDIATLIFNVLSSNSDKTGSQLVTLMQQLFERMGYQTINNDGYNDKGVDIIVKNNNNIKYLIQCKSNTAQTNTQFLNRDQVSACAGKVLSNGSYNYDKFILVTSSFFTSNAIEHYEHGDKIILIDRIGLLQLLNTYLPKETAFVSNTFTFYQDFSGEDFRTLFKEFKNKSLPKEDYKLIRNYAHNCPKCKYSKMKFLIAKSGKPYFKCLTCRAVFYRHYKTGKFNYHRTEDY
ncbi:restriction endonuclease [Streptococcus sp. zg-JUN1979]|uniref:restriction endonuclease n=1 Tax=Streptococcus sp. zg-JUN1979 TaxID=3391450 RepID=UPI0039A607A2